MHNKSFTVDNQATVVGGRNIGNEYFDADPDLEFADLDVLAVGPIVQEVSASFDAYWDNDLAYPITTLLEQKPDPKEAEALIAEFDQFVAAHQDSDYTRALANSPLARSVRADTLRFAWGQAELVHDDPDKIREDRDRSDLLWRLSSPPISRPLTRNSSSSRPISCPEAQASNF